MMGKKKMKAILGIIAFAASVFAIYVVYEWRRGREVGNEMAHSYGSSSTSQGRRITASEARAMMKKHPDAIVLDVRTEQEFALSRIPGAILLPDYTIEDRAAYVLPNRNALILVYCRSGNRSRTAASLLVSLGYTNVYDFGGISNWPYEVK
jgi:rhodanese-related sulfurtransferase